LTEAFKQAGITKAEFTDYTWHHLDDFDPITGKTAIELVEISAYEVLSLMLDWFLCLKNIQLAFWILWKFICYCYISY